HSNFGTSDAASAVKMREALALIRARDSQLPVDGEMHADCAVDAAIRESLMPFSTLSGDANLLVCPSLDSANIGYNLLKTISGNNVAVGPILLGCARPVHVLTPSSTVRRIVNMTARSEEHTSELQSPDHLVCRLLLEKKNKKQQNNLTK